MTVATLAGGCFWCTEAIFRRLRGVTQVTPGYADGKGENPTYEKVSSGNTGFTEAVQVEFDPRIISFEHLLDIFWAVHDPTTLNRQGPDIGTQYRSVIFYHDEEQKQSALKSKEYMEKSGQLNDKIVTEIAPLEKFYTAEEYDQDDYERDKDL
ncbi:MAG: peptide-methionine (S)-S-oxide reductase MsrA, partial [Patescibacteria group bacterium]|nr:peptide-methionine (S)-S-oxide reductase MsrA [Patescibacteria group bacterium]